MIENFSVITYTKEQDKIIKGGIDSISKILYGANVESSRSLLLCLDKYLDPYYGYELPNSDEIIILLQKQLFLTENIEIREDILGLLRYPRKSLDYLADNVKVLEQEPELLTEALYALGNTDNKKYVPIFIQYENYHIPTVQNAAREILRDLACSE